jgi:RNA polymerase sigma-70 factor (ECF subfamily)
VGADPLVALLGACARGDRAAFENLYRQTSAKLFGVALRIVRQEDLAEEVLQDCYIRIWNRAGDYREGLAAPLTWMASIVRNRSLDFVRRPNPEVIDVDGEWIESVASDAPGPLAALEQSREGSALARCLARLEAKQRQAIVLAFHDGLSHSELAAQLRQPLGTVKTWVRRGLARLKTCLEAS